LKDFFVMLFWVTSGPLCQKVCTCSVCFYMNKQYRLRLTRSLPRRRYVCSFATLNREESQSGADSTKLPSNKPQKKIGEEREPQTESYHSVGAEGVFQIIFSIILLYGSLLKKLFQTKSKSSSEEGTWKGSIFMKELENSIPHFNEMPPEYRKLLDNLCESLQELASEKSVVTYRSNSLRRIEQNVEEISRHLTTLQLQVEYLKSRLSSIDKIATEVLEPIKYIHEFHQRWKPSWSSRKDAVSSLQKLAGTSLVQESFVDDPFASLNVNEIVSKVQTVAEQVDYLSHFLREAFPEENSSLLSNAISSNQSQDSQVSDDIWSSDEFLELLSSVLPEATLEQLRNTTSKLSEKERWKHFRTVLTTLAPHSSANGRTFETKVSKVQVPEKDYQNMSHDELVEELKTRDSQVIALKEQVNQTLKVRKKPQRKTSKSRTPSKSKRKLSGSEESGNISKE